MVKGLQKVYIFLSTIPHYIYLIYKVNSIKKKSTAREKKGGVKFLGT